MFQPGAVLNTQSFGNRPEQIEVPHYDVRDPTSTDTGQGFFPLGKNWLNTVLNKTWQLGSITTSGGVQSANWILLGSGSTGGITSITGDTGGAEIPSSGNFNLKGTADQIKVTGSANTETFSLIGPYTPATYTAHGVLVGEGTSSIVATTAGTDGQVLIGATGADPAFGTLSSSTGVKFTTGTNSLAIDVTADGYKVNTVSGATASLEAQNMYICTDSAQTTLTLPATASVGDSYIVVGTPANTGGWVIAQNSSQTMYKGSTASTTGATGTTTSASNGNEAIKIMCTVANTDFCIMNINDTVTLA